MPFKDAAARRAYMKKYQAEYRQGKRRVESGKKITGRTLTARASAEKKRKKLWALENHEWRMQQQRERRREARADAERFLLQSLPAGKKESDQRPARISRPSKNKTKRTPQKAA